MRITFFTKWHRGVVFSTVASQQERPSVIGDSKLPIGMIVTVNGSLSLYVNPVIVSRFLPNDSWDRLRHSC